MHHVTLRQPGFARRFGAVFVAAFVAGGAALALTGCGAFRDWRDEDKGIRLERLQAPPGHTVSLFAKDLPKARQMAHGPEGTIFVGSNDGNVYRLKLQGGRVSEQSVIARGLTNPSGVAFAGGALFVSDRTRIVRFDNIGQTAGEPVPKTVIDGLPDKARHDAHVMGFGPDAKLYVAVGSPCNTCDTGADAFGTILRMQPDGSGKEVVARGLRNSVGFDWHPVTRELWFTENGQDELGPERPNDELNRVQRTGEHFGFPYCHDRVIADPEFGAKRACSEFTAPEFGLGAHVAALGMRFMAPVAGASEVRTLVARHGSHPPTRVGYDVVQVVMPAAGPLRMEPYLTGFLQGSKYWGRPVDVLAMPDGSVLVSDDLNGAIYRVARMR